MPLAKYHIHENNFSIKKIDLEIKEIKKWYNSNKYFLLNNKNNILENNRIRECNLLYSKKKLKFNSKELINLNSLLIKIKFYIKLTLQLLK